MQAGPTVLIALVVALLPRPGEAQTPAPVPAPQGPLVYLVAPSASTMAEAKRMLRFCRWTDTTAVRDADAVLVLVRSSSSEPMASQYDSLKWLRDAANSLANESGAQFHVYLYRIRQDLTFMQLSHRAYDVNETGTFPTPPGSTPSAAHCLFVCACG